MEEPHPEKRAARRFALHIPATVDHGENAAESAEIRDVSARGICLYLQSTVAEGAPINFTLKLPPEITLTESILVKCKGRIVRVEEGNRDGRGRR